MIDLDVLRENALNADRRCEVSGGWSGSPSVIASAKAVLALVEAVEAAVAFTASAKNPHDAWALPTPWFEAHEAAWAALVAALAPFREAKP